MILYVNLWARIGTRPGGPTSSHWYPLCVGQAAIDDATQAGRGAGQQVPDVTAFECSWAMLRASYRLALASAERSDRHLDGVAQQGERAWRLEGAR